MPYVSDGLPIWVHEALTDSKLMQSLKKQVYAHLENDNTATLEDVMSVNDISQVFEGEVEDFMQEWAG